MGAQREEWVETGREKECKAEPRPWRWAGKQGTGQGATGVPAGSPAPGLGEVAESRKPWLFRNRPLGAAFASSSCVTLARSLFSLSHGCLICQVGMEGPAQSVLQRSVWMCTSFEKVERRH